MMNWIICPIRNGLALTAQALPTFLNQDIGNVRVLFIENACVDGSAEWLRTKENAVVWHQDPPLSVAASWNRGLNRILTGVSPGRTGPMKSTAHDYALVVNNDVELRPDTYRLLVEDGGPFVTGVGVKDRTQVLNADPQNKRPHPDFSCYLIRRECWDRVGQFDEGYEGAYCEDCDYHVRMHRAGVPAICLDVPFLHHASGTVTNATPEEAERIGQQAERNRARFEAAYGCRPGTPEYSRLFE